MQYSAKLKIAMEKIKDVLKEYDLAGVVVLHTPGFSEYFTKINPSYSSARMENKGIHINVKKEHFGGDEKLRDRFVSDTSNMFNLLAGTTGRVAMSLLDVSQRLDKQVKAEHTGGSHSSHTEQNN